GRPPPRFLMIYLGYFIIGAVLVALAILAVPLSLGYDSTTRRLRVKWLGMTVIRRLKAKKPEKPAEEPKKKWKYRTPAIMWRLWQKRDLVLEIVRQLEQFILKVYRTLSFQDTKVDLSLPDPMWNGVLFGVLTNLHLQEINLLVNFENRNYARIRVTIYPIMVVQKLASLLVRLPYMRLLRLAWDLKKNRQRQKD
ncbi:MAG: hypothetical protein M1438_16650, partial [Deltaproteobacteria bacterium]|nr:hypothetical protein [Deltaproteobacteria bacterium]